MGRGWESLDLRCKPPAPSLPAGSRDTLGSSVTSVLPHPSRPTSVRHRVRHLSAAPRSKPEVGMDARDEPLPAHQCLWVTPPALLGHSTSFPLLFEWVSSLS